MTETAAIIETNEAQEVLLTEAQAARRLAVQRQTLAAWRCKKRYPMRFVKIGRMIRYRVDDIEAFLKKQTQTINPIKEGEAA